MKQGSTFVLIIDLDIDIGRVDSIIFTLKNKGNILTKEDWNFSDGKFKIPFTQEETVRLIGRTLIEAQVNFKDGNVSKSDIKEIFIKESLATKIIDGNNATEEHGEIELAIDGDVVYLSEDYTYLENKPKINGVALVGNVSPDDLNLATKEYVEREIATFDFIKIVDELPEVGLPNREYFVRKRIPNQNDLFDEWAWVNNDWEFKGTKTIEVDLSEYVKNTDYAESTKPGIVKAVYTHGLSMTSDGLLHISRAGENEINQKTSQFRPIVPFILDYAVMKALTNPLNHEWTEEEKAKALELLGGVARYTPINKNTKFVYGVQKESDGTIRQIAREMSGSVKADVIPITGVGGVLRVGEPTMDSHATTKKYVDDRVGSVESILTELHTYAQTKIGGEA